MTGQRDRRNPGVVEPETEGRTEPLFLERRTYRRRRLADAARALPVLGLLLWMLPLLWGVSGNGPRASSALVFLFLVWAVLVFGAGGIVFLLNRRQPAGVGALQETGIVADQALPDSAEDSVKDGRAGGAP